MRRIVPALGLALLSPLVAEYLLGDFPITSLHFLIMLAPTYGGATVLIREVARRAGLRWPSIVLMALAYGVFEEGIMTMSLFNPNYAGQHLLDVGFVPALGIGVPWTLFVLCLHTVWSVSVPIALVEELAGEQRTTPWLGKAGLGVAAVLALLGAAFTTVFSYQMSHFLASVPQLVAIVVIVVALVVAAFRLPRRTTPVTGTAPSPWLVLAVTLVAGLVFEVMTLMPGQAPAWLAIVTLVAAEAGMAVLALTWSARQGWGAGHRMALAGGALLTYAWHAFFTGPLVPSTPTMDLVSHLVFGLGALVLLGLAARKAQREYSKV
ncbi:hypothetical protein [Nonomuraea sediminis]|uniref:hypothetical protein n=1 Tax=Nonomuraea sediminis TaxID=2835864 RepID=UPI001BDD4081|nr:hypothetical protein [Nonomuraea sediminis]